MSRLLRKVVRFGRDTYRYFGFGWQGGFRGVYGTYERAIAAVPGAKKAGYNHRELAVGYQARLELSPSSYDYPILFHLQRILEDDCTVLDFGGNIGISYLCFRKYLKLENIKWIVLDVPEIANAGRETCVGMPNVSFVSELEELENSRPDILFASGSLQYLPSPNMLIPILIDRGLRPNHILINRFPTCDGQEFVTLQNNGSVFNPHHVFNRELFVKGIIDLGYELVDGWTDDRDDRWFSSIPFHPETSITHRGFYLREGGLIERSADQKHLASIPLAPSWESSSASNLTSRTY